MENQQVKTHCDCGKKLISKYILMGTCAKCQGLYRGSAYVTMMQKKHDELVGITPEERKAIHREQVKKSARKKREEKQKNIANIVLNE